MGRREKLSLKILNNLEMKKLCFLFFIINSFFIYAQVHVIGINSGINTITSWNGEPTFGRCSPYNANIGYSFNLDYLFKFKSRVTLNLRGNFTVLNFHDDDWLILVDEYNQIRGKIDQFLQNQYYCFSIGSGYLFKLSKQYSINIDLGATILYYRKHITFLENYPETRMVDKREWSPHNRFLGAYLSANHHYLIHRTQAFGLFLTGNIQATQVFDYHKTDQHLNRLIPELNLGVAVVFGDYWYRRF